MITPQISSEKSPVIDNYEKPSSAVEKRDNASVPLEILERGQATDSDIEPGVNRDEQPCISPADGGLDAWLFLAGCFVFEALIWGFPFSFGVFQSYYTNHPPFSDHANSIAVIGTCSTGVMYLFAPFSLYVLETWPSTRRRTSVFGLTLTVATLIAASFSTTVWQLILTQGVLYAIGGSLLYAPTAFYVNEWFIKRRGLAFGIMWAGVGSAGVVLPFILTALLDRYGFRTTLRIWAITLLVLCTPLIYFIRARLPISSRPSPRRPASYAFLRSSTFLCLQAANILESLGFFLPSIYLPLYARSIGLSPGVGTVLLALLNSSSVVGTITLGHLCDRCHVTTVIGISTLGSTLAVVLLWGLGNSLPVLILFAAFYGASAGGFSAIWTRMYKAVQEVDPDAGMGILMVLFTAGRGIGAVASGPISEQLLIYGGFETGTFKSGYGTAYGAMIVFAGVSAACGLLSFGARWSR